MISSNQLKNGIFIKLNDQLYQVVEFQHVKPGKGPAFVRSKIRQIPSGAVIDKTFRPSDKIDTAFVEKRTIQYLYNAGDSYHFMDNDSYEEVELSAAAIEDKMHFLKENTNLEASYCDNKLIDITLPTFVELKITETEPGFKGDTSKAGNKPATTETGAVIQVPLFINPGDKIKVDTRTYSYVSRL